MDFWRATELFNLFDRRTGRWLSLAQLSGVDAQPLLTGIGIWGMASRTQTLGHERMAFPNVLGSTFRCLYKGLFSLLVCVAARLSFLVVEVGQGLSVAWVAPGPPLALLILRSAPVV